MEHHPKILITEIVGECMHLHPFKAMYWESQSCLLVADLHLGKTAHFRKSGIPVPKGVADANWDRLISLLIDFRPQRLFFWVTYFIATIMKHVMNWVSLIQQFHTISFELVVGNHDILDESYYRIHQLSLPPTSIYFRFVSTYPLSNGNGSRRQGII